MSIANLAGQVDKLLIVIDHHLLVGYDLFLFSNLFLYSFELFAV